MSALPQVDEGPLFGKGPILVVEDDADLREIIADIFEDQGRQVMCAANGRQALDEVIRSGRTPRLILLDMMMPVMDGWEFRRAMRASHTLATVPVVVMTAHADPKGVAAEIGAVAALSKPVSLGELLHIADTM